MLRTPYAEQRHAPRTGRSARRRHSRTRGPRQVRPGPRAHGQRPRSSRGGAPTGSLDPARLRVDIAARGRRPGVRRRTRPRALHIHDARRRRTRAGGAVRGCRRRPVDAPGGRAPRRTGRPARPARGRGGHPQRPRRPGAGGRPGGGGAAADVVARIPRRAGEQPHWRRPRRAAHATHRAGARPAGCRPRPPTYASGSTAGSPSAGPARWSPEPCPPGPSLEATR